MTKMALDFADIESTGHQSGTEQSNQSFRGMQQPQGEQDLDRCDPKAASKIARWRLWRGVSVAFLIVLLGALASSLLLALGTSAARKNEQDQFKAVAEDVTERITQVWRDYMLISAWVQESCSEHSHDPRQSLRSIHQHVGLDGIPIHFIGCVLNVSHAERPQYEAETAEFLSSIGKQRGFPGFREPRFPDSQEDSSYSAVPRANASYYLPLHYAEPSESRYKMLDVDVNAPEAPLRMYIAEAVAKQKPVLSKRHVFPRPNATGTRLNVVNVVNPGLRQPTTLSEVTERVHFGLLEVTIPGLFEWLSRMLPPAARGLEIHLYDTSEDVGEPDFLGGAAFRPRSTNFPEHDHSEKQVRGKKGGKKGLKSNVFRHSTKKEICWDRYCFREINEKCSLSAPSSNSWLHIVEKVQIANREWTVGVRGDPDDYRIDIVFTSVAAGILLVSSFLLAVWLHTSQRRALRMSRFKSNAEAEKATIRLEAARQTARNERELNDYIAHEVRNPLSAAISACSFVSAAVAEREPLITQKSKDMVREDVDTISKSLVFINDLLRNMLDIHRAESNELKLEKTLIEIKRDILEPVAALLYQRDCTFKVEIACPAELMMETDKLRLKQIMLNLARNSAKFVEKGFVRLGAHDVDGHVIVFVEDSGPGVPEEKRHQIFRKYQESLDSLQQGRGVGLAVCRKLIDLLGGTIRLDEQYDSGVLGCPGARFVVDLATPTILSAKLEVEPQVSNVLIATEENPVTPDESLLPQTEESDEQTIPATLRVLFVDDDMILRKLFARSIKKYKPDWDVEVAASGEAALRVTEEREFDLIFMDQYMASVERQLLGTETVRAMRSNGITCVVCGLSANDVEEAFMLAGANAFLIKPFPTKQNELDDVIRRLLKSGKEQHIEDS